MNRPHVSQLHIQGFGCIQDATFELTPLHALIGPNDSGKSTVLRALRAMSQPHGDGKADMVTYATRPARMDAVTAGGVASVIRKTDSRIDHLVQKGAEEALRNCRLFRFEPDALRADSELIPDGHPLTLTELGGGLAAVYDAILTRDPSAYAEIAGRLRTMFPSVKNLALKNTTSKAKRLGVQLASGELVAGQAMSEGLLYWFAFEALRHIDPVAIVLIEEPENGLHPARIADVTKVLRDISETTQVLLATHSPILINELKPNEVTVVTRDKMKGTQATLMKNTKDFAERAKVYSLGELWVSYANGDDEGPLLNGGPRT